MSPVSRNELIWFGLFELGFALIAVERGWKAVCWNLGIGLIGWILGRLSRGRR